MSLYEALFGIDDATRKRADAIRKVARTTREGRTIVDVSKIPEQKLNRLRNFAVRRKMTRVGQNQE